MQSIWLDDVDFSAEEILEVHLEGAEVDQRGAWAELHEEIDVAGGVGIAAREGAEDLQAPRPVAGREREDLLALRPQEGITDGAFADRHGLTSRSMIPVQRP